MNAIAFAVSVVLIVSALALAGCTSNKANPSSNPNYCLTHPSECH